MAPATAPPQSRLVLMHLTIIRSRFLYRAEYFRVHRGFPFISRRRQFATIRGEHAAPQSALFVGSKESSNRRAVKDRSYRSPIPYEQEFLLAREWSMGSKTAGGEQDSCAPAIARLVGGALKECCGGFAPAAGVISRLHVVVHRELVRMRSQTQRVVFFLFHVDPVGDEAFVEHIAAQQEGMIGLERLDCAAE